MDIYFFRAPRGKLNFGDELNPWLWPQIVPELAQNQRPGLLVGIGTLLNDLLPADVPKDILGSGAGYGNRTAKPDASWNVHFVRGPHTAKLLGLSPDRAVTDGAILIPEHAFPSSRGTTVGFMPHWESALDSWRELTEGMGLTFVDPTEPIDMVFQRLASCRLLITEAMHGAIIADLMRIPWIAVSSRRDILDFKWNDWCSSLDLRYSPVQLPQLWSRPQQGTPLSHTRRWIKFKRIERLLRQLRKTPTSATLSDTRILSARKQEALRRLYQFRESLRKP